MLIQKLKEYLDSENVKYITISHPPAYTAQEIAHLVHVKGREMAKTVMINVNGKTAMAVLPASYIIDFQMLCDELKTSNVYLEDEEEFKDVFPDCELGAMPPFGNLYDMEVFVSKRLTKDEEIVFNAGTHTDLVKMTFADFERLVHPKVFVFSVPCSENHRRIAH